MKKALISATIGIALFVGGASTRQVSYVTPEVYFSPFDDITPKIVNEIKQAKKTIHGSLYGITNPTIATALIEAKQRNVEVIIGEDKTQSGGSSDQHEYLIKNGIKVIIKKTSYLEHNKWLVIDGVTTLEGSYNYSGNAQSQDNSFVIFRDTTIAQKFEVDFNKIIARDSI